MLFDKLPTKTKTEKKNNVETKKCNVQTCGSIYEFMKLQKNAK